MRTTKVCELGFGTKGPLALPNLAVVVDQEQPQALPPQPSLELP
jgi:predicted small lipoprotein YifL